MRDSQLDCRKVLEQPSITPINVRLRQNSVEMCA
jgi:hypothetical protein